MRTFLTSFPVFAALSVATASTALLPSESGNKAVEAVATDNAANTGNDVKNVLIDRTSPNSGSVDYTDGYVNGAVTVTTSNGSDSGSGLDLASASLQRDDTTLANDACNPAFPGSWSAASSPDSTTATAHCYRY